MTFALRNLLSHKNRTIGLALAIAFAVMIVVTLAVTSSGLENSATEIMTLGKADFSVAQKGVSDILSSTLDESELARVSSTPGVSQAVGVLVETERINAANPLFIEIGIAPTDLTPFGVTVVSGTPYAADATNQVMLGWRAAANFGLHVGSQFYANGTSNTVSGIYSTGNAFGDAGAMFPLPALQAYNRVPGIYTMVFLRVTPGTPPTVVANRIQDNMPELTALVTASDFGRADANLVFLKAAVTGSTILAVLIGAVIVGNTLLLSLFERTRELGLLRAIGWTRRWIVALLLGESLAVAVVGAMVGVGLSFGVTSILENLPSLQGVLHASYTAGAFWRALYTAAGMTLLGSLYPAIRAAMLTPLRALSYE